MGVPGKAVGTRDLRRYRAQGGIGAAATTATEKEKGKDAGSSIKDVEDDRRNDLLKHRLQPGRSLDDFSLGVDGNEGGGAFDDQALAGCFPNRVGKSDGGFS